MPPARRTGRSRLASRADARSGPPAALHRRGRAADAARTGGPPSGWIALRAAATPAAEREWRENRAPSGRSSERAALLPFEPSCRYFALLSLPNENALASLRRAALLSYSDVGGSPRYYLSPGRGLAGRFYLRPEKAVRGRYPAWRAAL